MDIAASAAAPSCVTQRALQVGQTLPMAAGFTYELCAGLIDKEGKTLEEITSEEIHEECG